MVTGDLLCTNGLILSMFYLSRVNLIKQKNKNLKVTGQAVNLNSFQSVILFIFNSLVIY